MQTGAGGTKGFNAKEKAQEAWVFTEEVEFIETENAMNLQSGQCPEPSSS